MKHPHHRTCQTLSWYEARRTSGKAIETHRRFLHDGAGALSMVLRTKRKTLWWVCRPSTREHCEGEKMWIIEKEMERYSAVDIIYSWILASVTPNHKLNISFLLHLNWISSLLSSIFSYFNTISVIWGYFPDIPAGCVEALWDFFIICPTFDGVCRLRMPLGGSSGGTRSAGFSFNWTGKDMGSGSHTHMNTREETVWYHLHFIHIQKQ